MHSSEVERTIEEFRQYLNTEEAKSHLNWLKEKEPREVKEVLEKLKGLPKDSKEFADLVLYGLLPNARSKYAKRASVAPAFLNIKKWFSRYNYTENDWKEISNLIYQIVVKFQENPNDLENIIRDFKSHKLSKGLQCGSLTPIFFALNPEFPIVTIRTRRTYRKLSFLVFGQEDKLSRRLKDYPSNIDKLKKFVDVMSRVYGFDEIRDTAVLDVFCFWYDEYVIKGKLGKKPRDMSTFSTENVPPIEERYITKFLQVLACSPPQPFLVETLQKLDEEGKIIYNTEF
ncbi:MAG: hypothetical protein ACPLGZ_01700, partial [Candidatus Pelagibacter ubique]